MVQVDSENMVGDMHRNKGPNGTFGQVVGIDSAEEYVDVVGIGLKVAKCSVQLAFFPRWWTRNILQPRHSGRSSKELLSSVLPHRTVQRCSQSVSRWPGLLFRNQAD